MSDAKVVNPESKSSKVKTKQKPVSTLQVTFAASRHNTTVNSGQLPSHERNSRLPSFFLQRSAVINSDDFQFTSGSGPAHDFSGFPAYSSGFAHTEDDTPPDDDGSRPVGQMKQYSIQTSLMVNAPGDQFEREADSIADAVMESSSPQAPTSLTSPGNVQTPQKQPTPIVRITPVQTSRNNDGFKAPARVEDYIAQMEGNGQQLPPGERTFFEGRMSHDFSQVRIHTGSDAIQASREIGAHAFTAGRNIAFNAGSYEPGIDRGRRLLAHELTHVIQQGAGTKIPSVQRRNLCPSCEKQIQANALGNVEKESNISLAENYKISSTADWSSPYGNTTIYRAIGDGHDLEAARFSGDSVLEGCYDGESDNYLRFGKSGEAVTKIQQALIDLGYAMPISTAKSGSPDGIFGSETKSIVKAFQGDNGLSPDGVIGPLSMDTLDRKFRTGPPPTPTPPTPGPPTPGHRPRHPRRQHPRRQRHRRQRRRRLRRPHHRPL